MVNFILQALYYFLPAYIANMAPVILKKINFLPQPVDFNKKWKAKSIFGSHKTWGGLFYAIITGTILFYIQQILYRYPFFQNLSLFDYSQQPLLLGFLLATGAIVGDLTKSFFKRRSKIKAGKSWVPFDQFDFIIGAFIFSFFLYTPPVRIIITILVLSALLHPIFSLIGYYLGLKTVKW